MSDYFRQNNIKSKFFADESWVILSTIETEIKRKIEEIGTPLKNWDINISRGIITGFNEAFIIDSYTRKQLINDDPNSAEIIRPILRGRDIKRYGYNFSNTYVILAYYGSYKILEKNYPAIYRYLLNYEKQLKNRGQCRYTSSGKVSNNEDFQGQHHWLELDNNLSLQKLEDFYKLKIMYPNMTKFLPFYLDDKGFTQNDKSFMITGSKLYFLTAFLNSSLFKYCFINSFPELQGGTRELRKIFFDKIPVIEISEDIDDDFKSIVTEIQQLKNDNHNSKELEIILDNKIFDLYKLTTEERLEIGFIEIQ